MGTAAALRGRQLDKTDTLDFDEGDAVCGGLFCNWIPICVE